MTLHQLEVFASIVRSLNVTKASKELHSSQSALSQHLKALREQFGKLTEKKGRHIKITDRGQAFFLDIEPILSQIAAVQKKYGPGISKTLNIGVTSGPSRSLLPSLMERFKNAHPKVEVSLKVGPSHYIAKLILDGKLELAVIARPFVSPLLAVEWYRKERLAVFVAQDHPAAAKRQVTAKEFTALPLIVRGGQNDRSWTDEFLCALMAKGFSPNLLKRLVSADAVKAAVRKREGLGILYYDVIKPELDRNEFRIITLLGIDLSTSSYIVYAKKPPLSTSAKDFLTLLHAARHDDRSKHFSELKPSISHSPTVSTG